MAGIRIGEVIDFDTNTGMVVIQLAEMVEAGNVVHFLGHGVDFQCTITLLLIDDEPVKTGLKGQKVNIKTNKSVKAHTPVYKIIEES
jgi:hypothetical protein